MDIHSFRIDDVHLSNHYHAVSATKQMFTAKLIRAIFLYYYKSQWFKHSNSNIPQIKILCFVLNFKKTKMLKYTTQSHIFSQRKSKTKNRIAPLILMTEYVSIIMVNENIFYLLTRNQLKLFEFKRYLCAKRRKKKKKIN